MGFSVQNNIAYVGTGSRSSDNTSLIEKKRALLASLPVGSKPYNDLLNEIQVLESILKSPSGRLEYSTFSSGNTEIQAAVSLRTAESTTSSETSSDSGTTGLQGMTSLSFVA
ncbi:MAG: hypothetical protein SFZ03_10685 [Candidatus Melainabacteria bacterium]|nr:hypothetical protein [Candidatus Melainabacteria bacterium]